MWTDLETHMFTHQPEDDPALGRYLVILLIIAAVAATLVAIYIALHAPMYGL
jgi:hypothetical protein